MSHRFTARTDYVRGVLRQSLPAAPENHNTNLTATSRQGTTVTAHATIHTKGSYTELIASTSADSYGLWLRLTDVNVANTLTSMLLDISVGAASSETVVIPDILAGSADLFSTQQSYVCGKLMFFPGLYIPSGSRIAARCQALITADTVNVAIFTDHAQTFSVAETAYITYGTDSANSRGTGVATGVNVFGSWTEIGTLSANATVFVPTMDMGAVSGQTSNNASVIQVGHGADSGSVTIISTHTHRMLSNLEALGPLFPLYGCKAVSSGDKLWIRVAGGAAETHGFVIHAI